MAVYHDARCRLCRREGGKLFLKGTRCFTDKCAFERRGYAPGEHGKSRRVKETNYGQQLREKQKARRIYGVLERQFRHMFSKATESKGVTGEVLLQMLERRLDNIVYRFGFALSHHQARQLVRHGHVKVNDKKVNIPSYQVEEGDVVSLSPRAAKNAQVTASVEAVKGRGVPKWLELDSTALKGKVLSMPARDDVNFPIQEQLIVELYSK
jgi:small subunit ribosomal protein S4